MYEKIFEILIYREIYKNFYFKNNLLHDTWIFHNYFQTLKYVNRQQLQ